jgi:hypothetical protein
MKTGSLLIFIFLIGFISCSNRTSADEDIIAMIGDQKISFEELEISFKLTPCYAIRTPLRQARLSQLHHLINEKYYYIAALAAKLPRDPQISKRINYIKNQEIIRAFLHQLLFENILINDQLLLDAYAKFDHEIQVKHLSVYTLEEANRLMERLESGEDFDQLAREIYSDQALVRMGENIGYVSFGDLDATLENAIYSMKIGEISKPLPSENGYHILKVMDIRQNRLSQTINSQMKLEHIRNILVNRMADQLIRSKLAAYTNGEKIQVNNRILDVLVSNTNNVMGQQYMTPDLFKYPIQASELRSIHLSLADIGNETLAKFGRRKITVDEFLERLKEMPPLHRPYLGTRSRMIQGVIDMVRNDLLLENALKQKVDKLERVKESSHKHIEKLLIAEYKKRINSDDFKCNNKIEWKKMVELLESARKNNKESIFMERLFPDVKNPDSVMAPPPIQVVIKNDYVW